MRSILGRTCKSLFFFSTCYHPTFKIDCAKCGTNRMTAADPYVFWVDIFSSMHDVVVRRESKTLRIMPFATDLLEPYRRERIFQDEKHLT